MNDKLAWRRDGPPDNANLRMRAVLAVPARADHRRQKRPRW